MNVEKKKLKHGDGMVSYELINHFTSPPCYGDPPNANVMSV
jgi:hypothetical protein